MGGIVIIGSGSALYNKHFRDRIRNYCGSNRQFLSLRDVFAIKPYHL